MRAAGFPTGWRVRALAVLLAIGALPAPANADAPRDIQTGQRLWLDGFDIGGADTTGNGGGANPASGAQVTAWKDKSPNGYTAGDATSYGAVTHTFPTYVTDSGVSFDGVGNALEVAGGIYPTGTTVSNTDIFIVGSTRTIRVASLFYAGFASSVTNDYRLNFHAPWTGGSYVWHHGTVNSALNVSWSGTGAVLGQKYIYNLGATTGSSQVLVRDGSTLGSLTSSLSYVQQTGASFYLGSGGTAFNGTAYQSYHDGLISEVIVYTRRLNTAEKNIIQSYLAAKYANPGGASEAKESMMSDPANSPASARTRIEIPEPVLVSVLAAKFAADARRREHELRNDPNEVIRLRAEKKQVKAEQHQKRLEAKKLRDAAYYARAKDQPQ